eukprot:1194792-Prorocentrum_minimum.AAC.3
MWGQKGVNMSVHIEGLPHLHILDQQGVKWGVTRLRCGVRRGICYLPSPPWTGPPAQQTPNCWRGASPPPASCCAPAQCKKGGSPETWCKGLVCLKQKHGARGWFA